MMIHNTARTGGDRLPGLGPLELDLSRPLYAQVIEAVAGAIARGQLQPGDPLPSVRELAGELAINPNTVQKAYRDLEREGLTTVRPGAGVFVHRDPERLAAVRQRRIDEVLDAALLALAPYGLDAGGAAARLLLRAAAEREP